MITTGTRLPAAELHRIIKYPGYPRPMIIQRGVGQARMVYPTKAAMSICSGKATASAPAIAAVTVPAR